MIERVRENVREKVRQTTLDRAAALSTILASSRHFHICSSSYITPQHANRLDSSSPYLTPSSLHFLRHPPQFPSQPAFV